MIDCIYIRTRWNNGEKESEFVDCVDTTISKSEFPGCNSLGVWGYTKSPKSDTSRSVTNDGEFWTNETWIDLNIFENSITMDPKIYIDKIAYTVVLGVLRERKINRIINEIRY